MGDEEKEPTQGPKQDGSGQARRANYAKYCGVGYGDPPDDKGD